MVRDPSRQPSSIVNIPSYERYGEDEPYRELWNGYDDSSESDQDEWYCVTCRGRLGSQEDTRSVGSDQRTLHHLVEITKSTQTDELKPIERNDVLRSDVTTRALPQHYDTRIGKTKMDSAGTFWTSFDTHETI